MAAGKERVDLENCDDRWHGRFDDETLASGVRDVRTSLKHSKNWLLFRIVKMRTGICLYIIRCLYSASSSWVGPISCLSFQLLLSSWST